MGNLRYWRKTLLTDQPSRPDRPVNITADEGRERAFTSDDDLKEKPSSSKQLNTPEVRQDINVLGSWIHVVHWQSAPLVALRQGPAWINALKLLTPFYMNV